MNPVSASPNDTVKGVFVFRLPILPRGKYSVCLLYTSDAADERSSVDLGGRRIIKKKYNICIRILIAPEITTRQRQQTRHQTQHYIVREMPYTLSQYLDE